MIWLGPMSSPATEDLHRRAVAGDGDAQFALSRVFDREGRHEIAVSWLDRAARQGHVPSMTWLGTRLLVGRAAPFQPNEGAVLLARAAELGDAGAAARVAVLAALGIGRPQSWETALDWLQTAAERGEANARAQLVLLTGDDSVCAAADRPDPVPTLWARAREAVDLTAWLVPPVARTISESPRIRVFEGFTSPAVCSWFIRRAAERLVPARVYDADKGGRRPDGMRTSSGAGFGLLDTDLILALMRARMAAAAPGLDTATFEPCNILRYDIGQRYEPHYDFLNPEAPALAETLARQGQRQATFLTYLNADYTGGETAFPELDWRFGGKTGDALLFFNVEPDGKVDPRTLHAGLPPLTGEKWLLSQWIRDQAQPII
jgi:prolyl 4-hydroxylase